MSGVQFVSFQQKPAVGIRDLGFCSVVVIMSKYGAILAYIPPLPPQQSADVHAGDNNVQLIMSQIKHVWWEWKETMQSDNPDLNFPLFEIILGFSTEGKKIKLKKCLKDNREHVTYS